MNADQIKMLLNNLSNHVLQDMHTDIYWNMPEVEKQVQKEFIKLLEYEIEVKRETELPFKIPII